MYIYIMYWYLYGIQMVIVHLWNIMTLVYFTMYEICDYEKIYIIVNQITDTVIIFNALVGDKLMNEYNSILIIIICYSILKFYSFFVYGFMCILNKTLTMYIYISMYYNISMVFFSAIMFIDIIMIKYKRYRDIRNNLVIIHGNNVINNEETKNNMEIV